MENNNKSLESKANENRWQKFGKRALKGVKHESKLLPFEVASAVLGYKGGEYAGKVASTARSYIDGGNWEANSFIQNIQNLGDFFVGDAVWVGGGLFQNIAQGMQDLQYGIIGGMVGGTAGVLLSIYPGRKIGRYVKNRFLSGNNQETIN